MYTLEQQAAPEDMMGKLVQHVLPAIMNWHAWRPLCLAENRLPACLPACLSTGLGIFYKCCGKQSDLKLT